MVPRSETDEYRVVSSTWVLGGSCLSANVQAWDCRNACSTTGTESAVHSPPHTIDYFPVLCSVHHRVMALMIFRIDFHSWRIFYDVRDYIIASVCDCCA